uniref:(northern house mosquito) hypothetical protein n=1 Tax=Culex pipiens TaxID=7175 RepID=A0A8D8FHU9_CULPI
MLRYWWDLFVDFRWRWKLLQVDYRFVNGFFSVVAHVMMVQRGRNRCRAWRWQCTVVVLCWDRWGRHRRFRKGGYSHRFRRRRLIAQHSVVVVIVRAIQDGRLSANIIVTFTRQTFNLLLDHRFQLHVQVLDQIVHLFADFIDDGI